MIELAAWCLVLTAIPSLLYLFNTQLLRPPPTVRDTSGTVPRVSVLIPARNEADSIGACVHAVLASTGVELEVIVLDDHSEDATAAIVNAIAQNDPRVRLAVAPSLPAGWCGKQHACFTLSRLAQYDILTFLDADVRLTPDALVRMIAFQRVSRAELVSGFPRQETGSLLEKLIIPLIHWLLTNYLPMYKMRSTRNPRFAAGCGQWFLTTRDAYETVGGHAAVRHSMHDGMTLPRVYRRCGFQTDIADATEIAVCRMYHNGEQVWNGLSKNAREGIGAWPSICVWTVLLSFGHIFPFMLLALGLDWVYAGMVAQILSPDNPSALQHPGEIITKLSAIACLLSLAVRLDTARRFRASMFGAVLHPFGVAILLAIQWYATFRVWCGKPIGWKGRAHPCADRASERCCEVVGMEK
ncbi:MAG: glycosyltransferase [Bacteroidales bacterium]|nr:glycosyltransferase [Bacteroidales bacterium]